MSKRAPLVADVQVALTEGWQIDVCRLVLGARQLQRGLVFVRELIIEFASRNADLGMLLGEIEFDERKRGGSRSIYGTDDSAVMVQRSSRQTAYTVCASTPERAAAIVEALRKLHEEPASSLERPPRIRTWRGGNHPHGVARRLDCPTWSQIEANYPRAVRRQLALLASVTRPGAGGRLVLFHGAPGTGKTTALRALIREWAPWCATQYVADPDRFFADAGYIAQMLATPPHDPFDALGDSDDEDEPTERWQLIVAEDADAYLVASGKANGSTGRLLNLADGVLGQGANALILLTTNEPTSRLHPALVRPGRCLAMIGFTAFPVHEAAAWLGDGATIERPMTLAELYERRGEVERLGEIDPELLLGQYL